MTRRLRLLVAALFFAPGAACRSASEGLASREVASVAGDVARRTGSAPTPPPCGDEARGARAALLGQPLDEERAVKLALLENAAVRASYERLGIARADLLQAGLVANPVFSASVKSFASGAEVEIGLAQSFVDLFLVPQRRRVAAEDLLAAQAEVTREVVRLVFDVRRAFVRVRSTQDVVRIRRESLAALTAARDLMRKLHQAGNVRDADLTVEEAGAARAQMGVDGAELLARDAREDLNVLLGLGAAEAGWTVEGELPALPAAEDDGAVESRATASSLDLLEEKARVQSALAASGLARGQGGFGPFDLGAVGKREASDGSWGFGPQVSTAIPVFDTGTARVLAANARAREHLARHRQLTVEIGAAARRLLDRVRALGAMERSLRETYLPLRARLVEQTTQTFNAMQIGAFDVLDAKAAEADARREHVETLAAAWRARLDLAELLAGSLNRDRVAALSLPEAAAPPTPPKGH